MSTEAGPVQLGTKRLDGGNLQVTYSISPGVRVHLVVHPEAYSAGLLSGLGTHVVGRLTQPHGVAVRTQVGNT